MEADLDMLESALGYFIKAIGRQQYWETIQRSANVEIDRPSAHLLITLSGDDAGECRLHTLAARLGVEAPSVSRVVQRLEQDKLVVRLADPTDGRASCLRLTRKGVRTIARIRRAKRQRLAALFTGWSAADRKQLARLLDRLARRAAESAS
ncbi:MAG TPA: MarR family transcriptional regulator [Candidatus Saccharimonadales bacterium]|nr:MarR family transcriptional regulator [Candidatus Saccharimonadales bacterium]